MHTPFGISCSQIEDNACWYNLIFQVELSSSSAYHCFLEVPTLITCRSLARSAVRALEALARSSATLQAQLPQWRQTTQRQAAA
jgi:hypothetical protein